MTGVMLRPLPDLPGISAFPELNLRLYVEVGGKPGVWFISLDATNSLAVWAARRFFHLPYFRADMSTRDDGQRIHYRSHRRSRAKEPPVTFKGTYWATSEPTPAKSGSIEHFLTERYCLYSKAPDGVILRTNVHHRPWPLQAAAADIEENTVGAAQGIDLRGSPALVHFSRCLDVVVWSPDPIAMPDPEKQSMLSPRL
jgi:uncharacterized protein YqjF (DUF2071 family)